MNAYRILIACLALAVAVTAMARADTGEYEVKAAFIYNFAKFVEWPETDAGADAAMPLCILGDDPFGPVLDTLNGRTIQGRSMNVVRTRNLTDLSRCSIVFVSSSERRRIDEIMQHLSGISGLLTISDIGGFAEHGGMIELRLADDRVRFLVNLDSAGRAELSISSRILRLAQSVVAGETDT